MARQHVIALILVVLLLVVLVLFLSKNGLIHGVEGFAEGEAAWAPPTLEGRVAQIVQATQDTLRDRKVNLHDEPVVYSVWSGHMSKRGVPPIYVTPDVYGAVRTAVIARPLDVEVTGLTEALRPVFRKEEEWIAYNQNIRTSWKPNYQGSY